MLEYPEFVPQHYTYSKHKIGHLWLPFVANILYKRNINIKIPNLFQNMNISILEALKPPIDIKLLNRIYDCNTIYIKDLFKLDINNDIIMIEKFKNHKWYKNIKERLIKNENIKKSIIKKTLKDYIISPNLLIGKNIKSRYKTPFFNNNDDENENDIIEVYIDRSIDTKNNIKAATFGIVIKYKNKIYEYSGKVIEYSTSSTLAEILGIFVTIILVPNKSRLKIFTDSKAALNILKTAKNSFPNPIKDKSNLSYLIYWLEYIIKIKHLEIEGK
jgi:ribonuclease HI